MTTVSRLLSLTCRRRRILPRRPRNACLSARRPLPRNNALDCNQWHRGTTGRPSRIVQGVLTPRTRDTAGAKTACHKEHDNAPRAGPEGVKYASNKFRPLIFVPGLLTRPTWLQGRRAACLHGCRVCRSGVHVYMSTLAARVLCATAVPGAAVGSADPTYMAAHRACCYPHSSYPISGCRAAGPPVGSAAPTYMAGNKGLGTIATSFLSIGIAVAGTCVERRGRQAPEKTGGNTMLTIASDADKVGKENDEIDRLQSESCAMRPRCGIPAGRLAACAALA